VLLSFHEFAHQPVRYACTGSVVAHYRRAALDLYQGRAPFRRWPLSPITAVILMFIAGIVAGDLRWPLEEVGMAGRGAGAAIVTLMVWCRRGTQST
jgi:hypothetical protein